jgi:hypothetical protein
MIIFPYSKLLHMPGLFFSPSRNQVDNPREKRHIAPWARRWSNRTRRRVDRGATGPRNGDPGAAAHSLSENKTHGQGRLRSPRAEAVPGDPGDRAGRHGALQPVQVEAAVPGGAGLPGRAGGRLADQGHRQDGRPAGPLPLAAGLSGLLRQVRLLHRQVPLLPRHARPEEHARRPPGPDAQGLPALLHAGRQVLPEAGRRRGLHRRGPERLVQLLPPVLAVPALLGVLPLRHRHRRDLHGRARDHGPHRRRSEVLQRDHRQGLQDRQQPRPARPGAGRHAGGTSKRTSSTRPASR